MPLFLAENRVRAELMAKCAAKSRKKAPNDFGLKIWRIQNFCLPLCQQKFFSQNISDMVNRSECIEKLRTCRDIVAGRFGVRSMRLFGSVARNEHTESSDVDICVEMEPSLLRRSGLKLYLEELLHTPVDVLRLHKNMDSYLTREIEKDGILIFK